MPKKRYKPEEIVAKLRQVDVLVSQSQSMVDPDQRGALLSLVVGVRRTEFEQVKR